MSLINLKSIIRQIGIIIIIDYYKQYNRDIDFFILKILSQH